mmetsp:Transcript_15324/g.34363  ORF Transcript_15324/g.34363 Transcript_15324/m.34363 type:complete len:248 (+) Transcript_15324:1586-2329(+)
MSAVMIETALARCDRFGRHIGDDFVTEAKVVEGREERVSIFRGDRESWSVAILVIVFIVGILMDMESFRAIWNEEVDWLLKPLELCRSWFGRTIWKEQSIDAKIPIVYPVSKISSVRPIFFSSDLVRLLQSLIHHVPHEPSLHPGPALVPEGFPILVHVPVGISHGVAVLAQYQRSGPPGFFRARRYGLRHAGIHGTRYVRHGPVPGPVAARPPALVLDGTGGVRGPQFVGGLLHGPAPSRLVSEAP